MSGLNLHIYFSPMVHESRMFKITRSLKSNGVFDRIFIAGSKRSGLPSNETLTEGVEIYRLGMVRGSGGGVIKIVAFIYYCFSVLKFAIKYRPVCLNVHSLTLIPIGLLIKLFIPKIFLIYDAHELETETNGSGTLFTIVKRGIERFSIGFFQHSFFVSPSILNWIEDSSSLTNVKFSSRCLTVILLIALLDKLMISALSHLILSALRNKAPCVSNTSFCPTFLIKVLLIIS